MTGCPLRAWLWLPLLLGGLAGCLPTGGSVTTTSHVQISTGTLPPSPPRARPDRMWLSDFRVEAERIEGNWEVIEPLNSRCEVTFQRPNMASRSGRIRREGPCFGPLFTAHSWTVPQPGTVTISGMGGRALLTLQSVAPDRLDGGDLVLRRSRASP